MNHFLFIILGTLCGLFQNEKQYLLVLEQFPHTFFLWQFSFPHFTCSPSLDFLLARYWILWSFFLFLFSLSLFFCSVFVLLLYWRFQLCPLIKLLLIFKISTILFLISRSSYFLTVPFSKYMFLFYGPQTFPLTYHGMLIIEVKKRFFLLLT